MTPIEWAKQLRQEGHALPLIARRTGRHERSIRRWLNGEPRRFGGAYHWGPYEIWMLCVLVGQGKTSHEIAAEVGRSWDSVRTKRLALKLQKPKKTAALGKHPQGVHIFVSPCGGLADSSTGEQE